MYLKIIGSFIFLKVSDVSFTGHYQKRETILFEMGII